MGGGSDPAPPPPPPDPMAEARAQAELERQLAEIRRQEAERERIAQEQREAARVAGRQEEITAQSGTARTRIEDELARLYGVDPSGYSTDIDQEIARIVSGVPTGASREEVAPYFTGDIVEPFANRLTETRRRGLNRDLDAFAAPGFATNLYSGTEDDAIIDAIIADQFGTATDMLQRAYDRGTLDDTGFSAAQAKLGEQRTAAGSRLQDLGGGLLEGFREQARQRVGTARDRIGTLSLGQAFDPASVQTGLQEQRTSNLGRLEGDIRRGLGGEALFNPNQLIQSGAVTQGVVNPVRGAGGGGTLLAAIQQRRENENRERGLGSQGVV